MITARRGEPDRFQETRHMSLLGERPEIRRAGGEVSFWASAQGKTGDGTNPLSGGCSAGGRARDRDSSGTKDGLSDKSGPVRKEKVEEARRKRQNGDYDTREVYRKIAERLMDYFRI